MLQITSGKLYPNGVGRKNKPRGVLYSNLVLTGLEDKPIVTAAGTLLQVDPFGSPSRSYLWHSWDSLAGDA